MMMMMMTAPPPYFDEKDTYQTYCLSFSQHVFLKHQKEIHLHHHHHQHAI